MAGTENLQLPASNTGSAALLVLCLLISVGSRAKLVK